ncbi:uncharacterized protein LOC103156895 isoform X1 [Poecilia formosa]|uniref:uncharacterized protein LOC103156895 isoform X1 n=2 Tax=Poecilia TaxID=8080 RepID=UPI0007BA6B11|nr:PREDICTED: uncharacterized protein LOC103156895 isoform X1 [Poecilia formosa]
MVSRSMASWASAHRTCSLLFNSSLSSVRSRKDAAWMWRLVGRKSFWIGGNVSVTPPSTNPIFPADVLCRPQVNLEVTTSGCGMKFIQPDSGGRRRAGMRLASVQTVCWLKTPEDGFVPTAQPKPSIRSSVPQSRRCEPPRS